MSCEICYETINRSSRKLITCILCDHPHTTCLTCFSKYLLDSTSIAPKCLFCQRELTMDFIHENTNKTFVKQYSDHIFNIRFSLEESKLPESQEEANRTRVRVERERTLKRLKHEQIILTQQRKMLKDDYVYIKGPDKKAAADVISDLTIQIRRKLSEHQNVWYSQYRADRARPNHGAEERKEEQKQFIKKCPGDDCRGFLSMAYKCGTCDKFFCPDCNEVKQSRTDEDHVCNEDAKATIALIKKDSKPCPKCAVMIYRSSGCPQMWCIQCHTAFDWNTGHIDTGYVHNPEYFRYLRERGENIPRNPHDIVNGCDNNRIPTVTEVRNALHGIASYQWFGWYDYLLHVKWYVLPNDAQNTRNIDYINYRVAYLNNEITKEEWKKQLKMRMKKDELRMERFFIIDMYCNVMTDMFVNMMINKDVESFQKQCIEIFHYTNAQMRKLNKKYGSKDERLILEKTDTRIQEYFPVARNA